MRSILDSKRQLILLFITVLVIASLAIGCGSSDEADTKPEVINALPPGVTIKPVESTTPAIEEPEELSLDKAETVLADFLSASDLHLKGEYTSLTADGMKDGPTKFEIWQKGDKMRIDDTRSNGPRSLIVSDGQALYYMYNSKHPIPAIMPINYYHELLGHDLSMTASHVSDDGKSAVFSFDVDAFYKNDSAQAGYYVTKKEYGVNNNTVLYQKVYGKDSYGPKPSVVNVVTQAFSLVEINKGIADTVFDAPF